jgi:hypothetical protein
MRTCTCVYFTHPEIRSRSKILSVPAPSEFGSRPSLEARSLSCHFEAHLLLELPPVTLSNQISAYIDRPV